MSICPACNGTGPLGAVLGVVCPRCGGSGVVSDAAAQAQTQGGETMSDELTVTVDVANVPAVVQILKESQEAIDALRAKWDAIPWGAIEECAVIADDDPDYRRDAKAVQRWIQEAQK